jgi:site-specific recombinase XerD
MLEYYFKRTRIQARIKANVLCKQIRKLICYMHDCGYQPGTIQKYILNAEHFGMWLKANGIKVSSVNKDTIKSFLNEHLPNCRCDLPRSRSRNNVLPALNCLSRALSLQNQKQKPTTPVEKEIYRFRAHMQDVCGLSDSTTLCRVFYVKGFLTDTFGNHQIKYQNITPDVILKYVSKKAKQFKPNTTKAMTSSLKCYFRFLQFKGKRSGNLIGAVPTIPNWKLATIPKTMTKEQLSMFLASFNLKTACGQRDYAIALCFLELGIRASEVKNLLLDDIDWKNSTITIRASKTLNSRILPLPVRLGKALACYLKNGRPKTDSRNVFVRHKLFKNMPSTINMIHRVVHHAYKRAGLADQCSGTHIFRHTLATVMHQKGATLKEVADILGHKRIGTTTIYTKVNLPMLAKVALPWPEVQL